MSRQTPRPSRVAARLVIAAAAVMSLVIGGAGGLVLGTEVVFGSPDPHDLPDLPADFPDHRVQYLPELTVTEAVSNLAELGLECELLTWPGAPDWQECSAFVPPGSSGASRDGTLTAAIEYDGEFEVRALTMSCSRKAGAPIGLCHDPFQLSIDTVFGSQPPDVRDQALDWVAQYADDEAIIENEAEVVTRAGDIMLTVSGLSISFEIGSTLYESDVYELVLRRA